MDIITIGVCVLNCSELGMVHSTGSVRCTSVMKASIHVMCIRMKTKPYCSFQRKKQPTSVQTKIRVLETLRRVYIDGNTKSYLVNC